MHWKNAAHTSGIFFASYLAVCLAVIARGHAGDLVEGLVEVAGAVVARADGNLGDGQGCVDQQGLRLADAAARDVLERRIAVGGLEGMGEVEAADVEFSGECYKRDGLVVRCIEAAAHGVHEIVFLGRQHDAAARHVPWSGAAGHRAGD